MGNITIYKVNGEEQLYAENSDEGIDILTPDARSKTEELVPEIFHNIESNGIEICHGINL
ncbi:hypothetical protein CAEBREN_24444 [Caenorhabditis brenneri]|uniref:Uncharacterized protein n=1 Tax=Caenorhabditis brenneri TaxID=135651 RepID=G0MX56_CAEBE|nr:hypothetical protein CAEBREN_24444 [Caenorhabditis brenneri]